MKQGKYFAVKIKNPPLHSSGIEVRVRRRNSYHTICEVYCENGRNAMENAELLARLLNGVQKAVV